VGLLEPAFSCAHALHTDLHLLKCNATQCSNAEYYHKYSTVSTVKNIFIIIIVLDGIPKMSQHKMKDFELHAPVSMIERNAPSNVV
jgi:hypothetical protein